MFLKIITENTTKTTKKSHTWRALLVACAPSVDGAQTRLTTGGVHGRREGSIWDSAQVGATGVAAAGPQV